MRKNITKLLFISSFIVVCFNAGAQNWIKKAPENIGILIVEKFESLGKNCNEKGERINDNVVEGPVNVSSVSNNEKRDYCNVPEKDLDLNLALYQSTQKELLRTCTFKYLLLTNKEIEEQKDKILADTEKYRYILRHIPTVSRSSTDNFLQWGFYLYDRKTGDKTEAYVKEGITRFYPLENLVADLNKKYGKED